MKHLFYQMAIYTAIFLIIPFLTACFSQKTILKRNIQNNLPESNVAQASTVEYEPMIVATSNAVKYDTKNILVASKKISQDALVSTNTKTNPEMLNTAWLVEKTVKKVEQKTIREQLQHQKLKKKNTMKKYKNEDKAFFKDFLQIILLIAINWFLFTVAFAAFKIGLPGFIALGIIILVAFLAFCLLLAALSGMGNKSPEGIFIKVFLGGILSWAVILGILFLLGVSVFMLGVKVI